MINNQRALACIMDILPNDFILLKAKKNHRGKVKNKIQLNSS